jgi:O-antigen ligase/tetratricopeptide (TPR) repeat protein
MARRRKAGKSGEFGVGSGESSSQVRHPKSAIQNPDVDRSQSVLLAAFVALVVARTLVPEDSGGQFGHGAPFAVLWLVLAGAWLLGEFRRPRMRLQFAWPDALVAALIAWHTLSALVALSTGHPRSAMNMLWDWVAMGVVYFLARQLVSTGRNARATIVVMLGLACGMSVVAIHQYFVTLPADMTAFEAAKHSLQALFERTGQWLPEGSSVRQQFEARLASRLPTATFTLSNSLAGFLVAWLVMLAGIAFELRNRAAIVATLLLGLLYCAAIWLAGSRSAGLAAMVGIALVLADRVLAYRLPRAWLRGAIVAVSIGVVGAVLVAATTSLGSAALAAAWRSVAFRLEYWRATLAMIADYPLFGCGPGQFQDTYTAYKLVGAAEEIQDPHNWLLEVGATAGTPAAILLVAAIAAVAIRTLRAEPTAATENTTGESVAADAAVFGGVAGIVVGTALAWLTGYPLPRTHVLLFVAGVVGAWFVWKRWAVDGVLPARLPLIAALALLVNLLAAGGIGYPSVADSLWLLIAIQVSLASNQREVEWFSSAADGTRSVPATLARWCATLALAATIIAAIRFEYVPVMACRTHLAAADAALAAGRSDASRAAFEAAVAADPWSALAAARLADQRFADYRALATESQRRDLEAADARARELAPRRSKTWAQSANFAATIFQDTRRVEYRNATERFLERALELYPTHAELHAQAAQFWMSVGEAARARTAALEALRLDDAMRDAGHVDRTLRPATRREMESLAHAS